MLRPCVSLLIENLLMRFSCPMFTEGNFTSMAVIAAEQVYDKVDLQGSGEVPAAPWYRGESLVGGRK